MLIKAHIPTYPSGHWLFGFASKGMINRKSKYIRMARHNINTKYYNENIRQGRLSIYPNYIQEIIERPNIEI